MIATLTQGSVIEMLPSSSCRGGAGELVAHGVGSEVGGRSAGVARKLGSSWRFEWEKRVENHGKSPRKLERKKTII